MSGKSKGTWIGHLFENRQMVPRWHSPEGSILSGERNSAVFFNNQIYISPKWSNLLKQDGSNQKNIIELAELQFVGDRNSSVGIEGAPMEARTLWAKGAALGDKWRSERLRGENDRFGRERERIHLIRNQLRDHPKQPLLWAELARSQLILGSDDDSVSSMACAIQLAPENVFLRRCASRMHLHVNDVDAALSVIRKHPYGKNDPRIVAAEIAVSSVARKPSKYASFAKILIDEEKFRPQHRSEVAAAIGTVELQNGKHKRARELFEKSLRQPTENALAQAQWASERDSKIIIPEYAWTTPCSHEADAMASRAKHDWDSVLDSCELWLESEPFASKPAELGSFSVFTVDQAQRACKIATSGLMTNDSNILLLNNRAVSLVYLGQIEDALSDVEKAVKSSGSDDAHLIATLGLIAYRLGMKSAGERYYGIAVARFSKEKNSDSTLLACLYWAREIARYDPAEAKQLLDLIKTSSAKLLFGRRDPEIESMMEVVNAVVGQESTMPPEFSENESERVKSVFDSLSYGDEIDSIPDINLFDFLKI